MRISLLILAIILTLWALWIPLGRSIRQIDPVLELQVKESTSPDSVCRKNIVAIQPYMLTEDYASEGHFYEKIKGYFEEARLANYFHDKTVVLLPEYLGTWLIVSGEKHSVIEMRHISGAMEIMIASNPMKFIQSCFYGQGEEDAIAAALFRLKAKEMARIYSEVFKELAVEYHVTISAGSIVLPGPYVEDNQIKIAVSKPLYNSSFVFTPDGGIDSQIVRKSFPITSELPFVSAYPINEIPVFNLPIGRSAILVCADSWYPETYERLKELGAELILVNSFCAGKNTMAMRWHGYDGSAAPPDVDHADITAITEYEAWVKYALPGRIHQTHAYVGATVFLRGELWDLGSDGQPLIVKNNKLIPLNKSDRAGIWNICF